VLYSVSYFYIQNRPRARLSVLVVTAGHCEHHEEQVSDVIILVKGRIAD